MTGFVKKHSRNKHSRKEMEGGSRKEMQLPGKEIQGVSFMSLKYFMDESDWRNSRHPLLVDALSAYRDILRRETSFLAREVQFRNLASIAGKISYLGSQSNSEPPPSSEIVVRFPYLVSNHEEALDFLLHEILLMRYRIESLLYIMCGFSIPIPPKKVKRLIIMCHALVWLSRRITRSDAINSREEERKAIALKKEVISSYDKHRLGWRSTWGGRKPNYGFFNDSTMLSPMQFTCSTPGIFPHSATTGPALQIYSIEIVDLNPNLSWPLNVWGMVAARDAVDGNRNLLFRRSWAHRQKVTQDYPFLYLTGPSRAILAAEDVIFEVELKMKDGAGYPHTAVLAGSYRYHSVCDESPEIARGCCTAKLSLKQLSNAIQATIVDVHIDGLTFEHGCQVFCYAFSAAAEDGICMPKKFGLLDCGPQNMPAISPDFIRLSRKVVAVESQGTLRVVIQAYGKNLSGHVDFPVKDCKTSEGECFVGNSKVNVTVAWSLLVTNKDNLMLEGYLPMLCSPETKCLAGFSRRGAAASKGVLKFSARNMAGVRSQEEFEWDEG